MIYVLFQFGILILLVLRVKINTINIYGISLLTVAGFLGLWAIYAMGRGNIHIRPTLMDGARLKRNGPYKYIRHPMYASVLLVAVSLAISPPNIENLMLLVGLLLTLYLKLSVEEKLLLARFPEYADYKNQTRYFIPFVL